VALDPADALVAPAAAGMAADAAEASRPVVVRDDNDRSDHDDGHDDEEDDVSEADLANALAALEARMAVVQGNIGTAAQSVGRAAAAHASNSSRVAVDRAVAAGGRRPPGCYAARACMSVL
jgi:hypothetical protein